MELTYNETRALQAMRAPGGLTAEQARERWPACGTQPFRTLVRMGLAAHGGDVFEITQAGRAACPYRNELLAAMPAQPQEENMPQGKTVLTRYAVAFPSDLHDSIESAITKAAESYDNDTLKEAIVIACTPLGGIEVRPVFIPAEAAQ